MTIILKNSTVSGKAPLPADLQFGELALNSTDGKIFMKLNDGSIKELKGSITPAAWVRNPTWLPMPATTSAQEQVDLLIAVYPESPYIAFNVTCTGGYTIDWGDGTAPQNIASATQVDYLYNFGAAGLSATNQVYKNALIKITPTVGGNTFTSINLGVKNSTSNLQSYAQPILDATISAACTTLSIGNGTIPLRMMERCTILRANITSANSLFSGCSSLQSVIITPTVTTNITNFIGMFSNCFSLRTVPLFDTSSGTDTGSMFSGCISLLTVPLFNTANVTSMSSMFSGCTALQFVPLFNTVKVFFLISMFATCRSLATVPFFNTTTVISMLNMFQNCIALKTIPLFDTPNVTNMSGMFSGCSALQSVPLLNTIKVTNMTNMFNNCGALGSVPQFNTIAVVNMQSTFQSCASLKVIPAFNLTSASSVINLFGGCSGLQQILDINLNGAGFSTPGSYDSMFSSCSSLSKIGSGIANTGPKFSFDVSNCKLSATSLNLLYTSLPTVAGETITVTGNVGIAGSNPAIATAKGWTVTGSLLVFEPQVPADPLLPPILIGPRTGFYKWQEDKNILVRAGEFVHGPGFDLYAVDHETYQLPIDGWYWFDDEPQARIFLNVPIDALFQE